ncbi:MAG: nuclear transport factor 2 family protein [Gaiellaceae bacterium]
MIPLLEQLRAALDAHDLDTFLSYFRDDYVGERPRHPGSAVSSRDDVRRNWEMVIGDVPDLRVEVPAAVQDGDTIWSEWRAYGTARSGAPLELRGVIIFGIQDERVAWSRMYMEPVEEPGLTLADMARVGPRPSG